MNEYQVVIAGGGPTGLMLAGELALAGIEVAIVERRKDQELIGARARGLHARSIEVLDQRGIAERFLVQGQTWPMLHFHVPLDISDLPSRHNYVLGLRQSLVERTLAEWVAELSVTVLRAREVTGFMQDDDGVTVRLSNGESLRAEYLVGCDGGRSTIRKSAGIEFAGDEPSMSWLIVEAETRDEPQWGFHQDAHGIHAIGKGEDGGVGIVLTERELRLDDAPTLRDVREALLVTYGSDFGIHSPTWISRFTDVTRQAVSYRKGRVLLAGDAAHIHPPLGGQGLNLGLQDAVNLGWKLAQVIKRWSPDSLLDSYHAERHPVAARVLRNTQAQVALRRTDARSKALGDIFSELLALDAVRRRLAAEISGLGIRYDLGEGHVLVGHRMPDLDIITAEGARRVFTLLHEARPLLLDFSSSGIDITPWADRVRHVRARCDDAWELPVTGTITAPAAVLARPDGYVAWAGDPAQGGLIEALQAWFGAA